MAHIPILLCLNGFCCLLVTFWVILTAKVRNTSSKEFALLTEQLWETAFEPETLSLSQCATFQDPGSVSVWLLTPCDPKRPSNKESCDLGCGMLVITMNHYHRIRRICLINFIKRSEWRQIGNSDSKRICQHNTRSNEAKNG